MGRHARTARRVMIGLTLTLAPCAALAGSILPSVQAPPRSPQVAVNGSALQSLFTTMGESVVVTRDQVDAELVAAGVSSNSTFTFQIELGANANGRASGLYNGHDANPVLMPVFPPTATAGWFAVVSYRTSPVRAIVNLFDGNATLISTTTYLGADRDAVGFYVDGAAGPVFSQDTRNPGAAAQMLFYCGTGLDTGAMWLAMEDQPLLGAADGDFADVVWYIETVNPCVQCTPTSHILPVQRNSWGQVKQRFR